jgi:hypothetical protein
VRLGIGISGQLSDERLAFARQLGVTDVVFHRPRLPGAERWEFRDLPVAALGGTASAAGVESAGPPGAGPTA